MGIIDRQIQKAIQPLVKQQKENFEKIEEKYEDLQIKTKAWVKEEVSRQLEELKNAKENKPMARE